MATSTIGTGYEIQNNVENLEKGLAIVETGNTATQAITAGQFVYWKGTMYTASTAIASGTSYAVGTNLTACPNGGLNTLNEKLMNADLLVTTHTSVTTAQHTVPSMAKYRMFELVYTTDDDSIWAQNSVIPASIFKSGIQMRSYYGVENTTTFCTYLDDTHVNMYNNSGRYARLYGLY